MPMQDSSSNAVAPVEYNFSASFSGSEKWEAETELFQKAFHNVLVLIDLKVQEICGSGIK